MDSYHSFAFYNVIIAFSNLIQQYEEGILTGYVDFHKKKLIILIEKFGSLYYLQIIT